MSDSEYPDCGAAPGDRHARWCDIEYCPYCGEQAIFREPDDDPISLEDRLR